MSEFLLIAGTWLLSDSIYSWSLYNGKANWHGNTQNFVHDHWVRLLRGLLAIGIIYIGWVS